MALRKLWSNIKQSPQSFEFSRAGYLFNAGFTSELRMGELGKRVLQREPKDRWVVFAYVQDAGGHGDGPGCWQRAYDVIQAYTKGRNLDYRENWHLYYGNFLMWRLTGEKKYLSTGVSCLDKMLRSVPAGADPDRVKKARQYALEKLRAD